MLVERIKRRSTKENLPSKIGLTIIESFAMTDKQARSALLTRIRLGLRTPALRAKRWDNVYRTQKAIIDALCDEKSTAEESEPYRSDKLNSRPAGTRISVTAPNWSFPSNQRGSFDAANSFSDLAFMTSTFPFTFETRSPCTLKT